MNNVMKLLIGLMPLVFVGSLIWYLIFDKGFTPVGDGTYTYNGRVVSAKEYSDNRMASLIVLVVSGIFAFAFGAKFSWNMGVPGFGSIGARAHAAYKRRKKVRGRSRSR